MVDVGGYVGDTAVLFLLKGARRVYCCEPFPASADLIRINSRLNHIQDSLVLFNVAVGGNPGKVKIDPLFLNRNDSTVVESPNGIQVEVVTLEGLMAKIASRDAVLKMNCEGCEYDVFRCITDETLRRFAYIQLHLQGPAQPLVSRLRAAGFLVKWDSYLYAKRIDSRGA